MKWNPLKRWFEERRQIEAARNAPVWARLELFGHDRIAGMVTPARIGGVDFLRVDVPEVEGIPAHVRYYGRDAVFCITPISEHVARAMAANIRTQPVEDHELRDRSPSTCPPDDDIPF